VSSSGMLLVVDDASSFRISLKAILSRFGFMVVEAAHGDEAIEFVRTVHFDAVLLEIDLPGTNGIDVCRTMRRWTPRLPIIMLTAQDDEEHKVIALEAGADDYVTKPFQVRELVARLNAAVRRSSALREHGQVIKIGDVQLDLDSEQVTKRGKLVHLTPTQFALVRYLMERAGTPIAHAELLRTIWGPGYANELTYLRTFMHQIRLKLEDNPTQPKYLITDLRFGYRFSEKVNAGFGEILNEPLCLNDSPQNPSIGCDG
jgi:two-component system, OmpR family, KDP operon response regulator KdpE